MRLYSIGAAAAITAAPDPADGREAQAPHIDRLTLDGPEAGGRLTLEAQAAGRLTLDGPEADRPTLEVQAAGRRASAAVITAASGSVRMAGIGAAGGGLMA